MDWVEIAKTALGIALRAIERQQQIKNGNEPTAGDIATERARTEELLKQLDDAVKVADSKPNP